jgi:cytochrome c peroxidase
MAVQSAFPITVPDEMLGRYGDRSANSLPPGQRDMPNDLLTSPRYPTPHAEMLSIYHKLLDRLLGLDGNPTPWQREYRRMFSMAYPHKPIRQVSIADVGNAIAHFEEMAFAANASPWDHYVAGDEDAISTQAKRGALIFYGKGRCAACHSSMIFSDFKYHGVGIFSKIIVNGRLVNDYGRWMVTGATEDRYRFRTPPLRNVTRSAPYFHDGSTANLFNAIIRHLKPLARANGYNKNGSFAMDRDQIASVSPVLSNRIVLSNSEIASLMAFLTALESQSRSKSEIVPSRVPSGIPFAQ